MHAPSFNDIHSLSRATQDHEVRTKQEGQSTGRLKGVGVNLGRGVNLVRNIHTFTRRKRVSRGGVHDGKTRRG